MKTVLSFTVMHCGGNLTRCVQHGFVIGKDVFMYTG
jgi:hypothetical protein